MLTVEMKSILSDARQTGWVMEPDAKRLLAFSGLDVPRFIWTKDETEAVQFAGKIGYPVVAKIVSPAVIHKSDVSGVITGLMNGEDLVNAFTTLSRIEGYAGVLVEEQAHGLELIIGAKMDAQFGPVVLFGMGGTEAEIYQDVALRMAPLQSKDVLSMIGEIKANRLITGYRGSEPINIELLSALLIRFSELVMEVEEFAESMDLNPVMCSPARCVIADARIMLKR